MTVHEVAADVTCVESVAVTTFVKTPICESVTTAVGYAAVTVACTKLLEHLDLYKPFFAAHFGLAGKRFARRDSTTFNEVDYFKLRRRVNQ